MHNVLKNKILFFINTRQQLHKSVSFSLNTDDWALMPTTGEVYIDDKLWTFKKHGLGLLFEDSQAIKIDIEKLSINEQYFTAWEISTYLRSLGSKFIRKHLKSSVDAFIEKDIYELDYLEESDNYFYLKPTE